jgi:histone deacetylase 1/2
MDNGNTMEYLEKIKNSCIENLRRTGAPSMQMTDVPHDSLLNGMDSDAEDEADDLDADMNPDDRNTQRRNDQRIARDDEFEDSDDEDLDAADGVMRQPGQIRRRNITDHPNPYADDDIEIGDDGNEYLMSGANGKPDEDISGDEEVDDQPSDGASTPPASSPGGSQSGQAKSDLATRRSTPAAEADNDDGAAEDMEIDAEEFAEEVKAPDDETFGVERQDTETLAPGVASGGTSSVQSANSIQQEVTPDTAVAQSHPTPPESPPTVPVPTLSPALAAPAAAAEDVEMTDDAPEVAKEVGTQELETENQAAEQAVEITKISETSSGEPAE